MLIGKKKETQRTKICLGKIKRLMDAGITKPVEIASLIKEPLDDVKKRIGIIESAKRNKTE